MDAKSLKKLNRRELLEILVQLSEQNDQLKEENETLKARLADRKIDSQEIGSIAQAALEANGYFKAAEEAAQQYLENIARIQSETEAECQAMLEEVNRMLSQAKQVSGKASEAGTADNTNWQEVLEGESN